MTLNQPPSPTKNRKPSFSGNANENSKVAVPVFEGANVVATATTTGAPGAWTGSPELPEGEHTYTAVAKEESLLGNAEGESVVKTFIVDTGAHRVAEPAASPSKNRTPTFSGSASENSKVTLTSSKEQPKRRT